MENRRPLILISNDDGIMAKGISELIKFLRPLGEIVVMAPDAPRSGSGCAITVTQPVHYQLLRKDVGLTVYKCPVPRPIVSSWRGIQYWIASLIWWSVASITEIIRLPMCTIPVRWESFLKDV